MERLRIDRQDFRAQPNSEQAFTYLREKVEAAGVFVLLLGNLGSYHSAIPVEAFRGFAIADPVAPFVVINDQDAKTAWSFTLMHEVVHLWLGATGVSGGRPAQGIEQFCNEVAAEILLPSQEVARLDVAGLTFEELLDLIATQATSWRVSRQMLAYSLLRSGRIGRNTWQALDLRLRSMWAAERQREKEVARGKKGGPNYYVIRRHRLGRAMLDFAGRSLRAGYLSPAKAAQVLGVNPRSVFPLLAGAT
jgi:Zn-dependent peptidase ImmA (M78 family)